MNALSDELLEVVAPDAPLTETEIRFITSLWTPREFRKGQFFQRPGEVTTHGAFVARGCFRTYAVDARGVENILHFSAERTFIGDITSAVTSRPSPYAVEATEPSSVLTISLASFNQMLERFPPIARGYRLGLQRSQGAQQHRIALALGANQSSRHPPASAHGANRPFNDYVAMELAPDLRQRLRRPLHEHRRATDHAEMAGINLRQRGRGFFGEPFDTARVR